MWLWQWLLSISSAVRTGTQACSAAGETERRVQPAATAAATSTAVGAAAAAAVGATVAAAVGTAAAAAAATPAAAAALPSCSTAATANPNAAAASERTNDCTTAAVHPSTATLSQVLFTRCSVWGLRCFTHCSSPTATTVDPSRSPLL